MPEADPLDPRGFRAIATGSRRRAGGGLRLTFVARVGAATIGRLAFAWEDLDLGGGIATIRRQFTEDPATGVVTARPTKRPRAKARVALHPSTVAALRRRRAQQGADRLQMGAGWPGPDSPYADLVFTWQDGRPIRPSTLTRMIARWSIEAGLPRLTPHGLRHSFATAALSARVPVEVVAARLGNTPRVTQEVYAHALPADDAGAAQLVGDLYRAEGTNRGPTR